jgi:hypothetical protein
MDRASMKWHSKKYGVGPDVAARITEDMANRVEDWREAHGLPAADSPLVRGVLMDMIRETFHD